MHRSIRRISEVELVARGYLLSDNLAPAVRLDHSQPHNRQSAHLRRTLQHVLSTAMHDNEKAQLSLLAAHTPLSSSVHSQGEDSAPSIGELKERAEQLSRMQSTTLSLVLSPSAKPCPLPVAADVAAVLSLLLASSRQGCQLLSNAMDTGRLHGRTSGPSLSFSTANVTADGIASPLASFSQLSHQLRSAEVRASLACQQLQSDATVELTSHIDYIRRAVHNVQRVCDELARQHITDSVSPSHPPTSHSLPPNQPQQTAEGHDEQSTLISELQRVRRRGQLLSGQGALFEGEGEWRDAVSEESSEDEGEEGAGRRLDTRRRMAEKKATGTSASGGVSHFVANLSMVRELKSVLSHRPTVHFASIQTDGDGTDEMFDRSAPI